MKKRFDSSASDLPGEVTPVSFQPPTVSVQQLRRAERIRKEIDSLRKQLDQILKPTDKKTGQKKCGP